MFHKPRTRLANVLKEVMMKYHPDMLGFLDSPENRDMTSQQSMELRQSVGSELCETGFNDDSELNERGLLLEELIDWLGKELLHPCPQWKRKGKEKGTGTNEFLVK